MLSAILACLNLHKVQSNAQRQQKWYKNLELDEKITYLAEKAKYKTSSKYQDKNRVKHKTDYWSKKRSHVSSSSTVCRFGSTDCVRFSVLTLLQRLFEESWVCSL